MIFALMSIPILIMLLSYFIFPSYSDGRQMITGEGLYSNQKPKLK